MFFASDLLALSLVSWDKATETTHPFFPSDFVLKSIISRAKIRGFVH